MQEHYTAVPKYHRFRGGPFSTRPLIEGAADLFKLAPELSLCLHLKEKDPLDQENQVVSSRALTQPTYYEVNRQQSSLLYTDHAIYSPDVPFFKVRGRGPFLPAPFVASVITMPAPNTGPFLRGEPDGHARLKEAFEQRWRCVVAIAADNKCTTLLLGAWGCGAFGGDPVMASETAAEVIARGIAVSRVVFAIPNSGKLGSRNFETFRSRLG